MPRSAGGTFTLSATMATAGETASSTTVNSVMSDVATEMTDSLSRSGKGGMSAALDMGGFKVTNGAAGTAASDLARTDQVQTGVVKAASAVAGTVDAIQVTFSPANTAWTSRETFSWVSTGVNTVTAPTISKDGGVSSKVIKKGASAALVAGDTGAAGYVCQGYYNGTDVILLNPAVVQNLSFAATTDVITATDTTKALNAASVAPIWIQGADVASAATVTFGDGREFNITGTTTITALAFTNDKAGRNASVKFAGALTLTHNATSLILPTGANITTAAGDTAVFRSEGSGNFRCMSYTRANGQALAAAASGGMTLLGTITTTSGNSQSLTSLTLTNYKIIELWWNGVSANGTGAFLVGNSTADDVNMTPSIAAAGSFIGITRINLATGTWATVGNDTTTPSTGNTNSPLTTSSTAISVAAAGAGSFDLGSITVYGVA